MRFLIDNALSPIVAERLEPEALLANLATIERDLTDGSVVVIEPSSPTEWVNRASVLLAAALASNDLSTVPS